MGNVTITFKKKQKKSSDQVFKNASTLKRGQKSRNATQYKRHLCQKTDTQLQLYTRGRPLEATSGQT